MNSLVLVIFILPYTFPMMSPHLLWAAHQHKPALTSTFLWLIKMELKSVTYI